MNSKLEMNLRPQSFKDILVILALGSWFRSYSAHVLINSPHGTQEKACHHYSKKIFRRNFLRRKFLTEIFFHRKLLDRNPFHRKLSYFSQKIELLLAEICAEKKCLFSLFCGHVNFQSNLEWSWIEIKELPISSLSHSC